MSWFPSKKLIVVLSSILSIGILIHLIGIYMYAGGGFEGVKGGSVSIGIVDATPTPMNPFQYGKDMSADFMYRLMFRGLIRYDVTKQIYTGDLANCDISDSSSIKCTLRGDAIWSDGSKVQIEDIIASIDTFRKSSPSEKMRVFLESVSVKKNNDIIEIRTNSKNTLMIDLLTYPIVRTDVIDLIRTGRIGERTYITSGPFLFSETTSDKTYGFDRITLVRNEKWPRGDIALDRIHFNFFDTLTNLIRSVETLKVVIPPAKNEKLDLGPRFQAYTYSNYEYFSVFFNTKTLSKTIRNSLHWQLGNTFMTPIPNDENIHIDTFFSTGGAILPTEKLKSFPDTMRDMGYMKKIDMIANLEKSGSLVSGEAKFSEPKYWTNSAKSTTIFADDKTGDILLTGTVPNTTKSVTINDYTLKEFSAGNTNFVYRVRADSDTLNEGKNTYTLSLDTGNGSPIQEVLTLYYSTDPDKLTAYKKQVQDEYNASQNTPAMIAERERKKMEVIEKVRTLSDEFYYNAKLEPFALKVGYAVGPQSTESYAQATEKALRLLGIKTELVAYGPKDLQNMIASGEKKYDILITGISVDGSIANIGQFFASGNTGSKINFSNYTNKTLDTLFAKLKATTDAKEIQETEAEIIKIFNTDSFFFPISSPVHRIFIDRGIKKVPVIKLIPDIPSFADIFANTSIKENYKLSGGKSIGGFFAWLRSQF